MEAETKVNIGPLAAALAKAQAEIQLAREDAHNPHFKSTYATLASVWGACRVALAKNELAVVQIPFADGPQVSVTTVLMHSSGADVSGTITMTARDASPQSIGSAITYGRRYGLSAMVGVAPSDDDDGEASHGRGPAKTPVEDMAPPPDDVPFRGPQAKVEHAPEKYDPRSEVHQERLSNALESRLVPFRYLDDIAFALKGKVMSEANLDAVIKRIVK